MAAVLAAAWAVPCVAQEPLPIENVRLPIESHPDGRIKTQLEAARAWVPASGPIRGEHVVAQIFDEQGATQLVVRAVSIEFDRAAGKATSGDAVEAVGRGVLIQGKGLDWDVSGQVVIIRENARVEFNRAARPKVGKR